MGPLLFIDGGNGSMPFGGRATASRGFTLIELLATVAVLAIILALAAPNVASWVSSSRVRTAASDLYASLILARSEAIKRNASVDVVPNAGGWASGWRVEVAGTVLREQQAPGGDIDIDEAGALAMVTYRRDGRLDGNSATFTISSTAYPNVKTRTVSVDLSGRPNVK